MKKKLITLIITTVAYVLLCIWFVVGCKNDVGFFRCAGRFILWTVLVGVGLCVLHKSFLSETAADDARYNAYARKNGVTKQVVKWTQETSASGRKYDVRTSETVHDTQENAVGVTVAFLMFSTVIFPIDFIVQVIGLILYAVRGY